MKMKKRGFKGKWAISVEVHYSSSTAGLLLPSSSSSLFFIFQVLSLFKFRGAFSLNERQIHVYFVQLSLSLSAVRVYFFFLHSKMTTPR